jgi:predicted nucleotidyltransferase
MIIVTEKVLDAIVAAIVQEIDPEQIYLFGSRARGEVRPDSDIDLLIIEQEPFGPCRNRWKELSRIRRTLSQLRIPKDILLYSPEEIAKGQPSK